MTEPGAILSESDSADSFAALMNAAVDAIIIIDGVGIIQRFNPAAQAMFGLSEADVVGENVSMLMPGPHREAHDGYLSSYLSGGRRASIIGIGREETAIRSNGETFPMHLSVGEATIGGDTRFVGIIRDLSSEKRAQDAVRMMERQLIHADRLVVLGELTAGIAHEINQPLTAIAAYADAGHRLIKSGRQDDIAELQLICEKVAEQARRAGSVIARLRGMARHGTVTRGQHNLDQIVKNVLLIVEYELKKHSLIVEYEPDLSLPDLDVDEIQIQQILVNLIKNAMDAIIHSGQSGGRITIDAVVRSNFVEISVTDNGPGVPESDLGRLFEPFYTTKPKGVGLGLSICKNIAVAHGGGLNYSPAEVGGSCFTLKLPAESIG
jgi:two-component system sensor kinase FixL